MISEDFIRVSVKRREEREHALARQKERARKASQLQGEEGGMPTRQGPRAPPAVAAPPNMTSYFGTIFAALHFGGSQPACLPEWQQENETDALFSLALPCGVCASPGFVVFCLLCSSAALRAACKAGDSGTSQRRTWGSKGARDGAGARTRIRRQGQGLSVIPGRCDAALLPLSQGQTGKSEIQRQQEREPLRLPQAASVLAP